MRPKSSPQILDKGDNMNTTNQELRFGVKPKGQIPYHSGDVYRINTYNEHCVFNNSDTDRYHVLLGYEEECK